MRQPLPSGFALACLGAAISVVWCAALASAPLVSMEPGGTISVSAARVPVGELIRAIGAAAGISVIVADPGTQGGDAAATVSLEVRGADPAGLIALLARTRGLSVERFGEGGGAWSIGMKPGPGGDARGAGMAWQGDDDWAFREHSGSDGVQSRDAGADDTMVRVTVGVRSVSNAKSRVERGNLYGYDGKGRFRPDHGPVMAPLRLEIMGKAETGIVTASTTARSFVVATVGRRAEIFHGDEVFFGGGFFPVSGARAGMGIGVTPVSAEPGGRVVLEIDIGSTRIDGWNRATWQGGEENPEGSGSAVGASTPIISGDRVSTTVTLNDGGTVEIGCYAASATVDGRFRGAEVSGNGDPRNGDSRNGGPRNGDSRNGGPRNSVSRKFAAGFSRERNIEEPFTVITVTAEVMK